MDPARNAANQAIDLANIARQCAVAHKSPVSAPPIPTAKPPLAPSQDFQNLKHSVYFDFNSNVLTAAERERLDPVIAQISRMAKNFKFFVVLTAYCDAPGTAETNQALAIRRAEVVRFYLTRPETGIIPDRVVIVAMGNGPATSEAGAPGKNREWRRVDLRISMTPPEEATQQQPAPESPPQPPPLPVPHH